MNARYRKAVLGWLVFAGALLVSVSVLTPDSARVVIGVALPLSLAFALLMAWYSGRHPGRAREREEVAQRPRYQ